MVGWGPSSGEHVDLETDVFILLNTSPVGRVPSEKFACIFFPVAQGVCLELWLCQGGQRRCCSVWPVSLWNVPASSGTLFL